MLIVCAFPKYTPRTAPGGWFWVWRRGGVMYHVDGLLSRFWDQKWQKYRVKWILTGAKVASQVNHYFRGL